MTVRYILEPKPGQCFARNAGLKGSAGAIIVFTDDDVRASADWLVRLVEPLLDGKADAATGTICVAGHLRRRWLLEGFPSLVACQEMVENAQVGYFVGANLAMTRRAMATVGAFDVELGPGALGFGDESLFSMQLIEAGCRIRGVPSAVVEHHFDVSRLEFGSLWKTAERMGRSEAYIQYHWRHEPLWKWGWWETARRTLAMLYKRMFGPEGWRGEGVPQYWLLPLVTAWGFISQYRIESRRVRRYEKRGLVKRGESQPLNAGGAAGV
jgi:glycosyltransferase involved in cell wall biosynthesis